MVLLPDVVLARFQHAHALYNAKAGNSRRAISTTSASASAPSPPRPAHGCAASSPTTMASISTGSTGSRSRTPHVAEFTDTTKRAPAGKQIIQMLIDGELDAVLGEKSDHPDLKPLFADVVAEEEAWFGKHRVVPINHMVVVSRTLSEQHPGRRAGSSSAAGGIRRGFRAGPWSGRDAALAGIDHRLQRAAKAHSAPVQRGRTVRRRHADALVASARRHHPRRRMIQYAETSRLLEARLLDTPPGRHRLAKGETLRGMTA